MTDNLKSIKDQLLTALETKQSIRIVGGDSKYFLGRKITSPSNDLSMSSYKGIINYEPTELYITVKAGTQLREVIDTLDEKKQMLAFEPPVVSEKTTMGGVVATGLGGPRSPFTGSARDYVLGIHCLNGLGKELSFGGQVMKNVAGYDLSRLLTGSYGTLGLILDVTFKVIPKPETEITCYQTMSIEDAMLMMHRFSGKVSPVSALCYEGGKLFVRMSGYQETVNNAYIQSGFTEFEGGENFWSSIRNYTHKLFDTEENVWRLSLPATARPELGNKECLIDWGGAQYWIATDRPAEDMFNLASSVNGSATLFKGNDDGGIVFHPLSKQLLEINQGLKLAFDPNRILNPGKMYAEI